MDSTAVNFNALATVDDSSCVYPSILTVTTTVCNGAQQVRMTGPWWNWDPNAGPIAIDNGNGTWTFTFNPAPTANMEYLLVVDGVQENLVASNTATNNWSCTPITDYWSYANRQWLLGSGNVTNVYGTCDSCIVSVPGCMDSTATNYNPLATVNDSSCTYPDCNGVVNGTALVDSCGVCQSAYIYNFITHVPTFVTNANILIPGIDYNPSQEIVVMPNDPTSPLWNSTCKGCTNPLACNYDSTAIVDDGSCLTIYGCIDSTATNYNPLATCDDNSCTYPSTCNSPQPTGFSVTDITHDRAKVNWADANTSTCMVDMYRVQYRVQGTNTWSQKTAMGSGLCQFGLTTTNKRLWNLTPSTTYEYRVKAWYCGTSASTWSPISTFSTLDECADVVNFAVSTPTNTRATFTWSAPSTPYSFVRIKLRVDTVGSTWLTAGGFGVMYPAPTVNKNGLVAGESYRASSRTWCDPNGGAYKALTWSPFIFWTQPGGSIRLADSENAAITDLSVYPNPSRDIFNVTFVSDEVQNLDISITNVVGEAVYSADLEQFVGQFTKEVSLATYPKGIYFLHVTTDKGVVIKKLTLQ